MNKSTSGATTDVQRRITEVDCELFGTDRSPTTTPTTTTTTMTMTTTTAIAGVTTALISEPRRSGKHVKEEAYWARIDSFVKESAMMSTHSKWREGMRGATRLSKAIISLEGKVAGKFMSSSPPRKLARRGSIPLILTSGQREKVDRCMSSDVCTARGMNDEEGRLIDEAEELSLSFYNGAEDTT
jgi:hypothetical protein